MAGFADDANGQDVVYADNVDFSGNATPLGQVTTNGQLLIGSTATPHIRIGNLTSTGSTVSITNGAGTINIEAGASVPTSFVTNSGTAVPVGNILKDLGSGSITTVGSGNTLTTRLTGLTNHNVLVGAGTPTITNVPPAASGTVLTSNGVSADPSFQAIPSSFAPNSTFQVADDFLFSNNGGGLAVPGSIGWNDSNFSWDNSTAAEAGHPGTLVSAALGAAAAATLIWNTVSKLPNTITLGGGVITINWVFKMVTLSAVAHRYVLQIGTGDSVSGTLSN